MGVPKFFRYTSERYPCLNELVKEYQIPDFDNMYLDMNGIIHNCSHPDDSNTHFRITEENIFKDIFHYISILFQIIKPKKLFFMAIDGVAPRAKMNQQRGRRFRSAREAEHLEKLAKERGEVLPKEERFDSNCITPGTVFMARLHEQLRYFVKSKITSDPMWANCRIVLSGHETPGEGEHKIMDYIRWARSQPDYDPNTRHCLYGLDADLIMLGMCTHELHFALLREEVKFGRTNQKATTPEETNFYLLHLSLLREYLEQEFILIKDNLPFEYDLEKIIDDWVLMGFLVGNDFIPHLPNMHIHNDAFPLLCKTYMTVLPLLNGYINEAGNLNLERFEKFMQELAKVDKESFQETYTDLKYFEAKTGKRPNVHERKSYKPKDGDTFNVDINAIKASTNEKSDLEALIAATDEMLEVDEADIEDNEYEDLYETETGDDDANFNMEFNLHKRDYYMNKLDYAKVTSEVLQSQAECFVRAIQWNLHYYYRGCASWCWFYPHHYAPYISDIKGFKDLKIEFELGKPFKPFEQLLAVLPASSKSLLPEPFHKLMVSEESSIFTYYPINFETDLNGKKNDWEAVVLIPFIDEIKLLSAMGPCYAQLTPEEIQRNTPGPMYFYNHTIESLGECKAPEYFQTIKECRAKESPVFREELILSDSQLIRGVLPKATRNLFYPGFPTMRHLKYKSSVHKNKVKVFDQPSRGFNMIIEIVFDPKSEPPLEVTADELLGKVIWVGWPHIVRAKVISVSNKDRRLNYTGVGEDSVVNCNLKLNVSEEANVGNMAKQWHLQKSTIIEHNSGRLGIDVGEIMTIVHAVNMLGYKYQTSKDATFVVESVWCSVSCGYALQSVVREVKAHTIDVLTRYSTAEEAFSPDDTVFLMTETYYGCMAKVVTSSQAARSGRVKVSLSECQEPTVSIKLLDRTSYYFPAHHAAARCGIRPQILSRITGIVFIVLGYNTGMEAFDSASKVNIGLNLKFNKKNEEVAGYTRRCTLSNMWLYSQQCVKLVGEYARQFPHVFDHLIANLGADMYEADLFPDHVGEGKPQEVVEWLKKQGHNKAVKRGCGSEMLEPDELQEVHRCIQKQLGVVDCGEKKLSLQVKINLLYKPDLHHGQLVPDSKVNFKLFDRVVNVKNMITVPLGLKGTITGIYNSSTINTVRLSDKLNVQTVYQIMFDEEFPGGLELDPVEGQRFYKLPGSCLLNISYGRKLRNSIEANDPSTMSFTGQKPNVLRTGDGHNSAFASFTGQKKTETEPVKFTPPNTYKNPESIQSSTETPTKSHDASTELLKAMLKISIDTPPKDNPPQQKAFPPVPVVPPQDMNWRQREASAARQMHPNNQSYQQNPNWSNNQNYKNNHGFKKGPNTNWRQNQPTDSAMKRSDIQPEQHEWRPTILQNPNNQQAKLNLNRPMEGPINPPMPPFPTFARDRIPMPNFKSNVNLGFHTPQQQQQTMVIHNSNLNNEVPVPNRYSQGRDPSLERFPKHLPDVESDQAGASRSFNRAISQITKNTGSMESHGFQRQLSLDKTIVTQMVPLQVVASQRRVQRNGDRDKKTIEVNQSAPLAADSNSNERTQTIQQQESSNGNKVPPKQKRKKKLRIAANLPNLNLE